MQDTWYWPPVGPVGAGPTAVDVVQAEPSKKTACCPLRATQNVGEVHDTELSEPMVVACDGGDHRDPFHRTALPDPSTAAQNVAVGHETLKKPVARARGRIGMGHGPGAGGHDRRSAATAGRPGRRRPGRQRPAAGRRAASVASWSVVHRSVPLWCSDVVGRSRSVAAATGLRALQGIAANRRSVALATAAVGVPPGPGPGPVGRSCGGRGPVGTGPGWMQPCVQRSSAQRRRSGPGSAPSARVRRPSEGPVPPGYTGA